MGSDQPTIYLDSQENNPRQSARIQKMKKNKVDYLEVRTATNSAASCIETRDMHGFIEVLEQHKNI